ncbi:Periplasmic solute binding protein [Burkholderia cenocepacia PC184]|nr:Periplasmic solute binding protein [Burkholderia cenocepacia PC184]
MRGEWRSWCDGGLLLAGGKRVAERVELAAHPLLEGLAGRLRLGDADGRHTAVARDLQHALGHRLLGLAVVDQHAHLLLAQVALERGDVLRAGFGVVHRCELEALVAHVEADRVRHIAEHGLGGRHGHALVLRAQCGDLVVDGLQRCDELLQVRLVFGLVRRVGAAQLGRDRACGRRHRRRVVPQVRVVAGLLADEIGDDDRRALRLFRRAEQFAHPRIVVGAVVDHDLRVLERAGRLRARFEQVRVLIGIAEDAGDRDVAAADLRRDVAVEILRGDDVDGRGLRDHRRGERQRGDGGGQPADRRQGAPRRALQGNGHGTPRWKGGAHAARFGVSAARACACSARTGRSARRPGGGLRNRARARSRTTASRGRRRESRRCRRTNRRSGTGLRAARRSRSRRRTRSSIRSGG